MRYLAAFLFLIGIVCLFHDVPRAQVPLTGAGAGAFTTGGGGGRTCSDGTHSANFLARTSGLTNSQKDAYCTLINGLDTDSTFALLDLLYINITNTETTAHLNLVSTNYTGSKTGSITFSAFSGYTGDGSTGFIDTGLNPSTAGGQCAANSCSALAYVLNSRTGTGNSYCEIGVGDGSEWNYIAPNNTTNGFTGTMNDSGAGGVTVAGQTNAQGAWVMVRTAVNAEQAYKNGSSTAIGTSSSGVASLPNATEYEFACRFGGSNAASNFSADNVAAIALGNSLTGAQAASLMNRINTYMTTYGVNVY